MKKILIILVLLVVVLTAAVILIQGNNPKEEFVTVKVFFNNTKLDPEFSCNKVFPVERRVPKSSEIERSALIELLNGPTQGEIGQGFFTSINSGVEINRLSIVGGKAIIDFNERLDAEVGGSCRVAAIRAQIVETLKQFPGVKDVIISINGRTEDILQP